MTLEIEMRLSESGKKLDVIDWFRRIACERRKKTQ